MRELAFFAIFDVAILHAFSFVLLAHVAAQGLAFSIFLLFFAHFYAAWLIVERIAVLILHELLW